MRPQQHFISVVVVQAAGMRPSKASRSSSSAISSHQTRATEEVSVASVSRRTCTIAATGRKEPAMTFGDMLWLSSHRDVEG